MGKAPASTRARRRPKSKNPERKWCTCRERCGGGKEVAASTYRSHNQTTVKSTAARGSSIESGDLVGGKRKVGGDEGVGVRETRRMRARRVAQNEEVSVMVVEKPIEMFDLGGAQTRPQKRKKLEHHTEVQIQGRSCEGDGEGEEDDESAWIPSVEAYYPIENGKEIDEDYKEDDQLRATLRAINEMVSTILSWD